jgi:two-component system, chemotaxis family, protein-glutamate methylesterase/glutaminase
MGASGNKIRLLVVDDSSFTRRSLMRMFEDSAEIVVVGVACDGEMALAKVSELRPDVVTLDVCMPVMDGLTALERIMAEQPTPVIMLSCRTGRGGEDTMRALELGAVDFVDKGSAGGPMEICTLTRELTEKITVAAAVGERVRRWSPSPGAPHVTEPLREGTELVLVGTSTGGPAALAAVLGGLPETFRRPILVVQHMPPGFTAPLADRLDKTCAIRVKEAEDGELLQEGCAYIAPAGSNLRVKRCLEGLLVRLDRDPGNGPHRPSVDTLFHSAAEACGKGCLAFVLTGMGNDGTDGALAIKKTGGRVFVESEETAVVYGMPKMVAEAMAVDGVLPLFEVSRAMLRLA